VANIPRFGRPIVEIQARRTMDAERIPSIHAYVEDYHDYANILIGLYMAATGVQLSDGLPIADTYARMDSRFQGPKDKIFNATNKTRMI
jgi:hypothetical protein